jgi:arsenate reductase
MKKIFHLGTCSTCIRIIKQLEFSSEYEMHDIKKSALRAEDLDFMQKKAGSYEALFSRKALKYRALGLNELSLDESDYRDWILKEYTFLKRPVVIDGDLVFVGNSKKNIEAIAEHLAK